MSLARMELVSYGRTNFLLGKFAPIEDHAFFKPKGGLWTCPVGSKYGWADWCRQTDFRVEELQTFVLLEFTGIVLTVDSEDDLSKLEWTPLYEGGHISVPRFRPLVDRGVDAFHLTPNGERATGLSYPRALWGWDCETVLILNPSSVRQIGASSLRPGKRRRLLELSPEKVQSLQTRRSSGEPRKGSELGRGGENAVAGQHGANRGVSPGEGTP